MKVLNKFKKIIGLLMLIALFIIIIYVLIIFIPNKNKQLNITIEKTIKYDYSTYSRDSKLYKEIFDKLEVTLNSEQINYDEYAEYISELFVIDFYTLDNKNSKDDIGGVQFIKPDFADNFKLNASNSIYKYIKNNSDGKRIQELPVVESVEFIGIKDSIYKTNLESYDSYIVELKWVYRKDLGYDSNAIITIIKDNDKLYIVEKN